MAAFTYIAKRNLIAGHTPGTSYSIAIDLQQADENPKPVTRRNVALSGNTVTVLHRMEETIAVKSDWFGANTSPSEAQMREFIYSVSAGEPFTYDDGASVRQVIMEGAPRFSRTGLLFTVAFTMRALS